MFRREYMALVFEALCSVGNAGYTRPTSWFQALRRVLCLRMFIGALTLVKQAVL